LWAGKQHLEINNCNCRFSDLQVKVVIKVSGYKYNSVNKPKINSDLQSNTKEFIPLSISYKKN